MFISFSSAALMPWSGRLPHIILSVNVINPELGEKFIAKIQCSPPERGEPSVQPTAELFQLVRANVREGFAGSRGGAHRRRTGARPRVPPGRRLDRE